MRLTKKKAIEIAIELWEWLAETGNGKEDWGGWEKYGENAWDCTLCLYDNLCKGGTCMACPYYEVFGSCANQGNPYHGWGKAKSPRERKEYANQFLEQLKFLKEE